MKYPLTYNVIFGCAMTCLSYSVSAQDIHRNSSSDNATKIEKRMENYRTLKNMGYDDKAIYEDLGNANFLNKDYETAVFWYKKLKDTSEKGTLKSTYNKRYQHALGQLTSNTSNGAEQNDWLAMIQSDYQVAGTDQGTAKYRDLDFNRANDVQFVENQLLSEVDIELSEKESAEIQNRYQAPIALTPDGNTAYFSKPKYVNPLYGAFSKKQLVHRIYKAEKKNGQWKNVREVAVAPKHASVMHPALSEDGKRLFFASNMPGTFGDYDIYVSTVKKDGSLGIAKNLGRKVNTKKNDLYPQIVQGNTLSFASEGHRGQGGLDVYMAQVGRANVSLAINLGGDINSAADEFAVALTSKNGTGYVMSNNGRKKTDVQKVAFSYDDNDGSEQGDYDILEALNNSQIDYTSSIFEDE
ncbi:cell envelope biogenesis protein OmpA [Pricia sp. S334]|uniref:Cell envelope biogenesis protein OmpA n=1 Tax=Pricia mediterranea TaxID=3076079 RepID=A0ABU3LB93_9FLAO|nr:cell envelope biogenesis protein OmpA [Pricia sp. S334]MDT7830454.1 cell envelope biogenesis protein OmpA [Pricia sp. S334]